MMKEKINDTEPGIKQIEREIERGCDNAKKYFWLFVVFFAAGLIVRNVMHDFFSAGIDSWKADPELNNFRYMWNTLMYVIPITLGMDELIAKAWRFVRERFRSYQTELKSRGIKRARARRDANRKRQDIVTLVKRQLTREISEGRFTANREAVKREVERRVKERMILSRNRNYSRLATASP
nr:Replication protein [Escherichia coli]